MSIATAHPPSEWQIYHRVSKTATYGFLAALPLIVMYELLVVFANVGASAQIRVGAEVWLKQLLAWVGDAGLTVFGVAVVLVGLGVFWYEREKDIPLRARYFVWMILESAVYAVLVALIVSGIVEAILMAALQAAAPDGLLLRLALSIGAGVYEELLFRVILVGGLFFVLRRSLGDRLLAYATAALIGAFIFSLVHYLGPLGDAFAIGSFLFRFLFGLVLNVLFLLRGFGIAAWTHALYDVMVVLLFQG